MYDLREIIDSKIGWTNLNIVRVVKGSIIVTFAVFPAFLEPVKEAIKLFEDDVEIKMELTTLADRPNQQRQTCNMMNIFGLLLLSVLVVIVATQVLPNIPMEGNSISDSGLNHMIDILKNSSTFLRLKRESEFMKSAIYSTTSWVSRKHISLRNFLLTQVHEHQEKDEASQADKVEKATQQEIVRLRMELNRMKELNEQNNDQINDLLKEIKNQKAHNRPSKSPSLYFKQSFIHNIVASSAVTLIPQLTPTFIDASLPVSTVISPSTTPSSSPTMHTTAVN